MSRIHDALKKAQQERAGSSGNPNDSVWPGIDDMSGIASRTAAVLDAPDTMRAENEQGTSSMGVEALLSRCRKNQWNPNPATLLFTENESHAAAKEVFRTLRT